MQAVKIIFSGVCILLFTFGLFGNCSSQKKVKKNYELNVHSSIDENTYLTIGVLEYKNKQNRYPAIFQLNGIIFYHSQLSDTTFQILQGSYRVNIGAISKEWTKIEEIKIMKGDSVSLKVYLKDDLSPLE